MEYSNYFKINRMKDKRININGTSLEFTCENNQFKTDINKGNKHRENHNYLGSVTKEPLYADDENSIWLEHAVNVNNPEDTCYWFMWYNYEGFPTIPLSAVMSIDEIRTVLANVKEIKF